MVYKRLERFLIQLDTVDSTNLYASQLLKSTVVSNGTIIYAIDQHSGRGQHSNRWTSEAGKNLTCSIILKERIQAKHSFYLNIITSLAVRKALSDLGLDVKIKWPNDILVGQKKIGGILIENQISGSEIISSTIGIGLNVNQSEFPVEIKATSIFIEKGSEIEIEEVLNQLYGYLDFYLDHLLQFNFDLLLKHYYSHLFQIGIPAFYEDAKGRFEGIIEGIDESGKLVIARSGEKKKYDLKEVSFEF